MSSGYDWERVLGQSAEQDKIEEVAPEKGKNWWPFARKQHEGLEEAHSSDSNDGAEPNAASDGSVEGSTAETGQGSIASTESPTTGQEVVEASPSAVEPAPDTAEVVKQPNVEPEAVEVVAENPTAEEPVTGSKFAEAVVEEPAMVKVAPEPVEAVVEEPTGTEPEVAEAAPEPVEAVVEEPTGTEPTVAESAPEPVTAVAEGPTATEPEVAEAAQEPVNAIAEEPTATEPEVAEAAPKSVEAVAEEPTATEPEVAEPQPVGAVAEKPPTGEPEVALAKAEAPTTEPDVAEVEQEVATMNEPEAAEAEPEVPTLTEPEVAEAGPEAPTTLQPEVADAGQENGSEAKQAEQEDELSFNYEEIEEAGRAWTAAGKESPEALENAEEAATEFQLYTNTAKGKIPSVFDKAMEDDSHIPAHVPSDIVNASNREDKFRAFDEDEEGYVPAALRSSSKNKDASESKYFVGDDLQEPRFETVDSESKPLREVHIDDLLREAVERRASDIHLTTGLPPMVRVDGEVMPLDYEIVAPDQSQRLVYEILTDDNLEKFEQTHELDFGYTVKGLARFRVNVYMQRGSVAAALRMIPNRIPSYDDLRLPQVVRDIAKRSSGLILVTGPTGSGKSTTIAAMIDDINATRSGHILTIEDPIEYLHRHKKCMVNQREMHSDTYSFHNSLRAVLREDPDIILVGELRDLETIEAALTLAETGHLVFGTLHTRNAPSTIDRVVDVFPSDQQDQIRVLLANTIEGIISQQLLPKLGGGRIAALEIMTGVAAVKNLIREGKTHQMYSVIETSKNVGMKTMDASLAEHFRSGYVSYEECLLRAVDKETFARLAKNVA